MIQRRCLPFLLRCSFGLAAWWAWWVLLIGCSSSEEFRRVEQAPAGMQINELGSATATQLRRSRVSNRYAASYEAVWDAAGRVVPKLEQLGELPVTRYDKPQGRIEVRETHTMRQDGPESTVEDLAFRGWKDDFVIEIRRVSDTVTKVTVHRTVLGIPGFRACRAHRGCVRPRRAYEPEESNGEIEEWFLTQVEEELKK